MRKISAVDIATAPPFPQWRFLQLTVAITLWMLFSPLLTQRWSGHLALQLMLLDLMLVTIWANPKWRRARRLFAALWALSVIASACSALGLARGWERIDRTLDVMLVVPVTAACAVGVVAFAFRAERPTPDGIFAMVVGYLLIAVTFAELQYLTLIFDHEALHLRLPVEQLTMQELRGDLVYFSLVTLATVGYGDIVPVSSTARLLATAEAVTGQFYMAVVVATFVSMYAVSALSNRSSDGKSPQQPHD